MAENLINLYSDTQTRPTPAMRQAMAEAPVGDEQKGEDPSVNRLCAMTAELVGKEDAVFLPSGTMCNEIAILVHCRKGDEIIADTTAHIINSEAGGPAALAGALTLVIASATGLMSIPHELIELGRSYKISLWQELCRIRLPYAVSMILSGLKVAITLSVVGAVVGEFVNADRGLGFLIVSASAFFQVPVAFGALVLLSLMGVVLFQIIVVIERIFFPWSAESAGNSFL